MESLPEVTIVIPARKEEANIEKTLGDIERFVKTPYRVLVVNDRVSTKDETANVVERFARRHKSVSSAILNRVGQTTPGFGAAVAYGVKRAKTPLVVIVMADDCDDARDIDRMVAKAREGYDVVCGSRYMVGGKKNGGPVLQGLLSRFLNAFLQFVVGVPTRDATNAYKLYKRSTLQTLTITPIMGVEASLHLFLQAYFAGAKITEVPTIWRGRTAGKSTFVVRYRVLSYARLIWWALNVKLAVFLGTIVGKYKVRIFFGQCCDAQNFCLITKSVTHPMRRLY